MKKLLLSAITISLFACNQNKPSGKLADTVIAKGGKIVGIMPNFMREVEWQHKKVEEFHFTETMHERKQKFLENIFEKLGYTNKLHFFDNGVDALEFLDNSDVIPFIILSDINMPKFDGFALKDRIQNNNKLQLRSIPFIFISTSVDEDSVITAYNLSVQGFFKKQVKILEMEKTIKIIMEYWIRCAAPNNFK